MLNRLVKPSDRQTWVLLRPHWRIGSLHQTVQEVKRDPRDIAPKLWHHADVVVIPDTHRLINALSERGFSAQQAEAITNAIQEIDLSNVATRGDLRELEIRILKWMIPLMAGQAAVFGVIVKWLVG